MSSIMVNLSLCKHMHDVTVTSHDLNFVIFLDRIAVFSRERKTCEFMEISSLLSVVHMRIMNINQEKKILLPKLSEREHKIFIQCSKKLRER